MACIYMLCTALNALNWNFTPIAARTFWLSKTYILLSKDLSQFFWSKNRTAIRIAELSTTVSDTVSTCRTHLLYTGTSVQRPWAPQAQCFLHPACPPSPPMSARPPRQGEWQGEPQRALAEGPLALEQAPPQAVEANTISLCIQVHPLHP